MNTLVREALLNAGQRIATQLPVLSADFIATSFANDRNIKHNAAD
jgi:hypothetical protein